MFVNLTVVLFECGIDANSTVSVSAVTVNEIKWKGLSVKLKWEKNNQVFMSVIQWLIGAIKNVDLKSHL